MRRSREVPLTLLAAAALASVGSTSCGEKHCVDARNRILPDSACQSTAAPPPGVHFVSGGSTGGHVGDSVVGGADEGVSRGGFGHGAADGGGDAGE